MSTSVRPLNVSTSAAAASLNGHRVASPSDPTSPTGPKSANPLTDLISTEHLYVEQLASVIRRVAAAWSRSNFPPKALDQMFRAIEGCFRANRSLLAQLDEIGPNPSSPKALGDLLMRWIDDLEPAYLVYTAAYKRDFDTWEPVTSNQKQTDILQSLEHGVNTLDGLFILPYQRLKYYKKLYTKLLKSTQPGRSDHRMLSAANDKIDELLAHCESARHNSVQESSDSLPRPSEDQEEEAITFAPPPIPTQPTSSSKPPSPTKPPSPIKVTQDKPVPAPPLKSPMSSDTPVDQSRTSSWAPSQSSSASGSAPRSASERSSGAQQNPAYASYSTQQTSLSSMSTSFQSLSIQTTEELEAKLDTSHTLDVFSLMPKKCRLQINPPGLPFRRSIRFTGDVSMTFQLSSMSLQQRRVHISQDQESALPTEINTSRARVYLLTDLFLLCEQQASSSDAVKMLFPPLAGKHLRVSPVQQDPEGREFEVLIMQREVIGFRCNSREERDRWLAQMNDCINFKSPQPLRVVTDPRALTRSGSVVAQEQAIASGGVFSPMLPPSTSPGLGPPSKSPMDRAGSRSPVSSTYSHRSSDQLMSPSLDPSVPPRSASRTSPRLPDNSNSRNPSPLGWQPPARGLPHDPRPSLNTPINHPFQASSLSPDGHMTHPSQPRQPSQHFERGPSPQGPPRSQPPMRSSSGYPSTSGPTVNHSLRKDGARSHGSLRDYAGQQQPQPHMQPPMPQIRPDQFDSYRSFASSRTSAGASYNGPLSSGPSSASLARQPTVFELQGNDDSPPSSPQRNVPVKNTLILEDKCKVFLQTNHQQWKSLGSSKLLLYDQQPTNVKQLVVNANNKEKTILISTIVMADGVERVGKTGVAIELSDQGVRTGIIYMLQLKTDLTATKVYNTLVSGSGRQSLAI